MPQKTLRFPAHDTVSTDLPSETMPHPLWQMAMVQNSSSPGATMDSSAGAAAAKLVLPPIAAAEASAAPVARSQSARGSRTSFTTCTTLFPALMSGTITRALLLKAWKRTVPLLRSTERGASPARDVLSCCPSVSWEESSAVPGMMCSDSTCNKVTDQWQHYKIFSSLLWSYKAVLGWVF